MKKNSSKKFEDLKRSSNKYEPFHLSGNPFSIAPLFRDFSNQAICEADELLFTLPTPLKKEIEILLSMTNRRVLFYGHYGVGKTSLVDFIFYLSHNFHRHFCSRIIITQDNLERAIQEILFSFSMDIISEISRRSLWKPIKSVQKWLADRKYSDFLLTNLARLIGKYSEENSETRSKKQKGKLKISPGGVGGNLGFEEEVEIRKSIQSYVEILPLKKVIEYLGDFLEIINKIGFNDVFLFLDEADHLKQIDQFIHLLTRSREVLFSRGYSFFVAGSIELARYLESMGTIFDKVILVRPADWVTFQMTLEQRIQTQNPKVKLPDLFEKEALEIIFQTSKGIRKQFLRLAQNSLDQAILSESNKVTRKHCETALKANRDDTAEDHLDETQTRILKYLAQNGAHSSSDKKMQKAVDLERVYLRKKLEELVSQNYLLKERVGRKILYSVLPQYLPYFRTAP